MPSTSQPDVIIETRKLSKTFSSGGVQQHVLKNLDLEIYDGDFTVIMGPSGAGKSTLLYAISGMDKPTLGAVIFDGEDISGLSNDQLALFRRKYCGFVFQQVFLVDNMSVLDNVLVSGLLTSKSTGRNKKQVAERAGELLEQVGIESELWGKFPNQLSGGEAQRVGIIRALINEPRIVFADEPTGSLNSASGASVLDLLTELNRNNQSIVMVTHDLKSACRGSRIVYLRDGVICGQCNLGSYQASQEAERMNQLQAFLTEMGW